MLAAEQWNKTAGLHGFGQVLIRYRCVVACFALASAGPEDICPFDSFCVRPQLLNAALTRLEGPVTPPELLGSLLTNDTMIELERV